MPMNKHRTRFDREKKRMKFYCQGREWDTDRPVYIAGFVIKKSWFPIKNITNNEEVEKYGLKCRKGIISKIYIDFNNGQSYVKDIQFYIPKDQENINARGYIISDSAKGVAELYKKYKVEAET